MHLKGKMKWMPYCITEMQAFLEDVISFFLCQLIPSNYT